jgi:protein TonB
MFVGIPANGRISLPIKKPRRRSLPEGGLFRGFSFFLGAVREANRDAPLQRLADRARKPESIFMIKTWQCILLAVVVHGLIFCLPLTPKASREPTPETIQLVITDPPPPPPQACIAATVTEPPRRIEAPSPPPPAAQKPEPKVRKPPKKPLPMAKAEEAPARKPERVEESALQADRDPEPETTATAPADASPGGARYPSVASAGAVGAGAIASAGPIESKIGAIGGPQFLRRSLPQYPRLARRLGVEGTVTLRLAIDASGKLSGVEVIQSAGHGFDEEALRAVQQSSFAPAVREGRPIACLALLQIRFQLNPGD